MNILVSYNWLKHYAAIKDAPDELARKISLCGPSVERINHIEPQFKGVIVGRILDIQKHPHADKLQLVKVAIKEKNCQPKDVLDIVCGAFNIEVGDKVPVAVAGAELAKDFKITEREVRGIKSQGMLCSEKELGISDNHAGIFILPEDTPVGADFAKAFALEDHIFDTEITTNRPDALGMVGYAREVSVITGAKFLWKEPAGKLQITNYKLSPQGGIQYAEQKNNSKNKTTLSVRVEDKKACPRYMAVALTNIKVKNSPFWLKKRLLAAGLRPINNIVDITNYVMLEYGQPMHAFDADKLENFSVSPFVKGGLRGISEKKPVKNIVVRRARSGEEITTLDGIKRKLTPDNLVIADNARPIAVAGVMGGIDTTVSEDSRNIIFEAANFNPLAIRRSARSLNLHSDSSSRFEKLLSPEFTRLAILRAMELAEDLSEAGEASKISDTRKSPYFPLYERGSKGDLAPKVKLEYSYLWEKMGLDLPPAKALRILKDLGFKIAANNKKQLVVIPPYWRQGDIEIAEDLVEEIARVYGYHNLPLTLPKGDVPLNFNYLDFAKEEKAKDFLCGAGFAEIYSNSMVSEKLLTNFGSKTTDALKLKNPLNEDLVYMRTSLVPSLLNVLAQNTKHKKEANIFELANIYRIEEGKDLPKEAMILTLVESGSGNELFVEIKGVFVAMAKKLGITEKDLKYVSIEKSGWHPGRTAAVRAGDKEIGVIGEIHPLILKKFGLDTNVAATELNWEILAKLATNKKIYAPIGKFPAVKMDLAIVLDKKIFWSDISAEIASTDAIIKNIELFDLYEGDKVGQGKKSAAFHVTYQSNEKTLNDEEIKKLTDKIIERLKNKFAAELRK